ncbi:MAG: alpha/beta hydrolase [Gammaproteobacteria bacterium]|nr:alpha/beta hydrolase [Gammaproteobacteria bacterium]MYE81548.1 alpha/beta hydrolase [Gammaproteobacteria bacterium]
MAIFERDDITLYYEDHGAGFPVLLFAPGGMRSAATFWEGSQFNPIVELSTRFRVIAMDQRNAGRSRAPVSADDGWHTYTADHIALLDHLGVERTHLLGGCIGGPYCLGLIQAAPERVASAVLQQSIGFEDNRQLFYDMFQGWADDIAPDHPEADEAAWRSFRSNMYDGDFDFNVGRDFVASCETPMLVLMGSDPYHPESTSREIADIAPNATLVERWKSPAEDGTVAKVIAFLEAHTP